ncbi:MAG: pentapeptide repeat-containing protein [Microcoleaceae cyanobacterium]
MTLKAFLQDERCPESIRELAREPLILYLLAAMYRDEQLQIEMLEKADTGGAKVLVYEQALEWVLEKQRSQDGRNLNLELTKLDPEDLRSVLAEAGLCVVQSRREYASIKMIEDRLLEKEDLGAKELIEAARKASSEKGKGLKNALAAFYLKSGVADNSVEFFHKSFGEFLCAECMAETIEGWSIKTGKRRKPYEVPTQEVEWQIYDLFGYGPLTAEIVEYLMAILIKNQIDFVTLFERTHEFYLRWSDGEFIEATEETLPQKKARQLQQQSIETGQRTVDIYTGLNVMILLFELHRYGQKHENLKEKLSFHPCRQPNTEMQEEAEEFDQLKLLRIIGYSEPLKSFEFIEIVGKFLIGAYLSRANLSGANLSRADLYGIRWDDGTKWSGIRELHKAINIPSQLEQRLDFAASILVSQGQDLVREGNFEKAIEFYREAQALDPQLEISALTWNQLCWVGSVYDHANLVLFAGEKAVELEPENSSYRNTRGLARALTGDIAGAIEDFQVVVDSNYFDGEKQEKRRCWLESLKAGENPFTPEELENLRREAGLES